MVWIGVIVVVAILTGVCWAYSEESGLKRRQDEMLRREALERFQRAIRAAEDDQAPTLRCETAPEVTTTIRRAPAVCQGLPYPDQPAPVLDFGTGFLVGTTLAETTVEERDGWAS